MRSIDDPGLTKRRRIVLVGTGTGVGKTHIACSLLAAWIDRGSAVGLKPIETGVDLPESDRAREGQGSGSASAPRRTRGTLRSAQSSGSDGRGKRGRSETAAAAELSDQERLARAAHMFHVKQGRQVFHVKQGRQLIQRGGPRRGAAMKHGPSSQPLPQPLRSLYAFSEPVSPHLAARDAATRIDIGAIERWVDEYEAITTVVETAGGLFSPLGHGATNFELVMALRPDAVLLVAPDRLGVLHELTTTLALAAARGGPAMGVVLSAPAKRDASTGRNADELAALGIARPIAVFPRAPFRAPSTVAAVRRVIAWVVGEDLEGLKAGPSPR